MLGTELLKGQGLGNQLFCYVTTRSIALDRDMDFSILGGDTLANNIHSSCGLYFMDLDMGVKADIDSFKETYYEHEDRLYTGKSRHDRSHGAYITGTDKGMWTTDDNVLLFGNMQAEDYFIKHREEIKEWLKVKPEYDCYEYSKDNLCILHLRCTDYMNSPELFLEKKYWIKGMKYMKSIRPDMEFLIVTNDVKEANKFLPGVPAVSNDLAKDYSIIKNATYLLLSNSSFTYFPALCSDTVKFILAPKYWARHNVSDGYWASEQNIYSIFNYMDRKGRVYSADECRQELEEYKKKSAAYKRINKKPGKTVAALYYLESEFLYKRYRIKRLAAGLIRRIKRLAVTN